MPDKAVLAYSGGLDTTVAISWLKENMGIEVAAVAVDVGQGSEAGLLHERALQSGALEASVLDASREFAMSYVAKALAANALYQQKYPLISALSRPLICERLVQEARRLGCKYIAHGCTGKGNDQVRFEVALGSLAPDIEVLAPVREWGMSREQSIEYGLERGLPVPVGPSSPYSIDQNMWGRTIECGALEDPMAEPPEDVWERTTDPFKAPSEPAYLEIEFDHGLPVSLDGVTLELPKLVAAVDQAAGAYGFGRVDMIEDRTVGIKSREIYEAPGALTLIKAHADLEELTLDRETLRTKRVLEQQYANLIYEGMWFSPLKESIDAFIVETSKYVNGKVRLRLEPGNVRVVGRSSLNSLYDTGLATYTDEDAFDHAAAKGFVKIWGLPSKIWGRVNRSAEAGLKGSSIQAGTGSSPESDGER